MRMKAAPLEHSQFVFSFAEYPVAPGLRSRRDCFGGVGRYGDEGVETLRSLGEGG